jgi:arylsulfatase
MHHFRIATRLTRNVLAIASLGAAAVSAHGQAQPATQTRPVPKSPNVLLIALDDVGFSDLGSFGSEIRTPNIDSLARSGLRYTNFQSKAICSPTRASIMTGRNPQTVGMADLPPGEGLANPPQRSATGEGNRPQAAELQAMAQAASVARTGTLSGVIPSNAEMLAEALHRVGYETIALGKWHLTPGSQDGSSGNNSTMPLQRGFDYFYGYKMGWTDQYHPDLYEGNTHLPDPYRPGYYLAEDLADHAIAQIKKTEASDPSKPFFMYLAFTFAHTPLQAPQSYIDHYKGAYDKGWDEIRQERFAREKKMGLVPADTKLPPRENGDPSWNSLTAQQKRVYAHFMETYAGYIEHGDVQLGRVLEYLRTAGLDKNTLIILFSDNGSASETKTGGFRRPYGDGMTLQEMDDHLSELGGPKTQPLYQRPWAYAGGTPFRRYKLWPQFGGTRTPMIVSFAGKIKDPGGLRNQMVDAVDIGPTILQLAGTSFQKTIDGVEQIPVAGRTFDATFTSASAPTRSTQFFDLRNQRAILSGEWRAVAMHKFGTSFDADQWQLFNVKADPSESTDLSAKYPQKLKEMQDLWQKEAEKANDLPLRESPMSRGYADAFQD